MNVNIDLRKYSELKNETFYKSLGKVENVVHTLHRGPDRLAVGDAGLDERVIEAIQVFAVARPQVVEHDDFRLALVMFDDMAANESGPAGYKYLHPAIGYGIGFRSRKKCGLSAKAPPLGLNPPPGVTDLARPRCRRPASGKQGKIRLPS